MAKRRSGHAKLTTSIWISKGRFTHTELDVGKTKKNGICNFYSKQWNMFQHLTPLLFTSAQHLPSFTIFIATVVGEYVPKDRMYKTVPIFLLCICSLTCMPSAKLYETHVSSFLQHWHVFLSKNQCKNTSWSVRVLELLCYTGPCQWKSGIYLFYYCIPSIWPHSLVVSTKFCLDEHNTSILPQCH